MDSTGASSSSSQAVTTVADDTQTGVFIHEHYDGTFDVRTVSKITKGTMICLEGPLMSLKDYDTFKVYAAYLSLSSADRVLYDKLPTDPDRETGLRNEILIFLREHDDKANEYPELLVSTECLRTAAKAMTRFEYHARHRPGTELSDVPRMVSFIQHDCVPNAAVSHNTRRGLWSAYAIKDIGVRGTILTSWIDCTLPLAQRKQALLGKGIQECPCIACGRLTSGYDQEEIDRVKLDAFRRVAATAIPGLRKEFVSTYEQMLAVLSPRPEFSELQCEV
jgi:hypothetical protein